MPRKRPTPLPPPLPSALQDGDLVVYEPKRDVHRQVPGEVRVFSGVPYVFDAEQNKWHPASSVRLLRIWRGGTLVAAIQDTPSPRGRAMENNPVRLRALHGKTR